MAEICSVCSGTKFVLYMVNVSGYEKPLGRIVCPACNGTGERRGERVAETCGTCRFFRQNAPPYDVKGGECRRRSPVMVGTSERGWSEWPYVQLTNWCGEYEQRCNGTGERKEEASGE